LALKWHPTAERLTINILKLKYFFKVEKNIKADLQLTATFFHHGRRFYQQKLETVSIGGSGNDDKEIDLKSILTTNVPAADIHDINIHFEFSVMAHTLNETIQCGTVLLGEKTRFEEDWQKMIEYPREFQNGWYQFY